VIAMQQVSPMPDAVRLTQVACPAHSLYLPDLVPQACSIDTRLGAQQGTR
jgi:hypothetical protein